MTRYFKNNTVNGRKIKFLQFVKTQTGITVLMRNTNLPRLIFYLMITFEGVKRKRVFLAI